jgi:hypothetical protein
MHGDAQRAMIGIAVERVQVRDLDHRQQRQQNETEQSGGAKSSWLPASFLAKMGLESCQLNTLHQGYTEFDAGGWPGFHFVPAIRFPFALEVRIERRQIADRR